jgi:hypothetical protein
MIIFIMVKIAHFFHTVMFLLEKFTLHSLKKSKVQRINVLN